ncbi:MAG TPA: hypothetical protein VGJ26_01005 [Pirellulales bacterium]|jgi:hypothetical protein
MKVRKSAVFLAILSLMAADCSPLFARGGGGGGRGGFGGGHSMASVDRGSFDRGSFDRGSFDHGGSYAADRSPSMSRAGSYDRAGEFGAGNYARGGDFNRTTAGYRAGGVEGFDRAGFEGAQPTAGQVGHFLNLPQSGAAGAAGARAATGAAAARPNAGTFANNHPNAGNIAANHPNAANRAGQFANNHPNAANRVGDRQFANNVRNNVQNNYHGWYNHGWWGNHPGAWNHNWNYWHGWGRYGWWGWSTWPALSGFMIGSWASPMLYGYGGGGNVVYQGDTVYVNDQPVGTPEEYAQQAQQIAAIPAPADAGTADWMSLGVFAVSTSAEDVHPVMTMQLAVSKEGNLAGMYYNTSSDKADPIQGAVDRKTQRAAWSVGSKTGTVLETGIYNLTKEQTPVLVHFADGRTQTWQMVRLAQPKDPEVAPAPGPAAPSDTLDGSPSGD